MTVSSDDANKIISEMKANNVSGVVIKSNASYQENYADVMEITVPEKLIAEVMSENSFITVESGDRSIEIDEAIAKAIAGITNGEVTICAKFDEDKTLLSLKVGKTEYNLLGVDKDGFYTFVTAENRYDFDKIIAVEKGQAELLMQDQTEKIERITAGVKATTIKLKSKTASKGIRVEWSKSKGYRLDGYQVYRSVKRSSGYGKSAFYTTSSGDKLSYLNTKQLKKGQRYYYKVRGVRVINGIKVYTQWSNKARRIAK